MQQGLILRDRIFTVSVLLPDKPGELSKVSETIAKEQGNVIKLEHNQVKFNMIVPGFPTVISCCIALIFSISRQIIILQNDKSQEKFTMKWLLEFMHTPKDIFADAYTYIMIICAGIVAQMLYNLLASLLRAIGNSKVPLYFLILSALLNILLDLVFIIANIMVPVLPTAAKASVPTNFPTIIVSAIL